MSSALLALLAFCVSSMLLFTTTSAQMTFSDGWGKRSMPSMPFAFRHSAPKRQQQQPLGRGPVSELFLNENDDAMNPAMEACHVGYAQRLVQLHEQMLALFGTYQQCQTKAMSQPKKTK